MLTIGSDRLRNPAAHPSHNLLLFNDRNNPYATCASLLVAANNERREEGEIFSRMDKLNISGFQVELDLRSNPCKLNRMGEERMAGKSYEQER